jgi:hypothetical protein
MLSFRKGITHFTLMLVVYANNLKKCGLYISVHKLVIGSYFDCILAHTN